MKRLTLYFSVMLLLIASCMDEKPTDNLIDETLAFSAQQYTRLAEVMSEKDSLLPRTFNAEDELVTARSNWWTSGFFPGSLWNLYSFSGDPELLSYARIMTDRVENEKFNLRTHDLGFMIGSSFGNGLKITGDERYKDVMITAAKSLSTRFRPRIGLIQSWDSNPHWQCPVIIDNMMNLGLLFEVFRMTGDSSFYRIAVSHADSTIKHHYKPDFCSYHVVSFDTITGNVQVKQTHQGFADESAWSRGQAWGLYGFTMMYRETGLEKYLKHATGVADFLINHPNMPEDYIPYWDFNASDIPNALRDASAAAIMASALIELSGYTSEEAGKEYLRVAESQIRTLSSPDYLSGEGENGNFILKHGVGNLPGKSEVDVPLTYGDYYFIEALMRYKALPE